MTSSSRRTSASSQVENRQGLAPSSILDHGNLPEDREVGSLHRDGGIWDWDEHRATYDLAAKRAMALLGDLRSTAGIEGAIARGFFSVATSSDEDHFAVRMSDGRSEVYKWPTVPPAEESKDVVLVVAFLGTRWRGESLLEPQDIPLAVRRALIIGRNVPVLICIVNEDGLVGQRFQLKHELFARLIANRDLVDASDADIELSRWVTLLMRSEVSGRFKELADTLGVGGRGGRLHGVVGFLKRAYERPMTWLRQRRK